jgi:hypothetical protein
MPVPFRGKETVFLIEDGAEKGQSPRNRMRFALIVTLSCELALHIIFFRTLVLY